MKKKQILTFSLVAGLLLNASPLSIMAQETTTLAATQAQSAAAPKEITEKPDQVLKNFDGLITEQTFTNKVGLQAWTDYKEMMSKAKLADLFALEQAKGSNIEEIDAIFKDKKAVQRDESGDKKGEYQIYYRYPDPDGKQYEGHPLFYSEILCHFANNKLVYTSVQPGFFEMKMDQMLSFDVLSPLVTVDEFSKLEKKPRVMTVSELNIEGHLVTSLGSFAQAPKEQENMPIILYSLFSKHPETNKETVFRLGALPFEYASQDFGNASFKAIQDALTQNPEAAQETTTTAN